MRPAEVPADARRLLLLASGGVLLAAADTYVVVLVLPDMMTGVGITTDQLQRATPIISVFLLGYVAMLPLVGRLSDRHGRTPALIGCLAAFALGSAFTAAARALPLVVVGRGLQGLGGGGLVPVTLAVVADSWPPRRRGVPLGAVGAVQETGSLLGPLYGAAVVAVATWRTVFWVNLVVAAALAVVLAARSGAVSPQQHAREDARPGGSGLRRAGRHRGDPVGWLLLCVGLAGLLLALIAPAALTDSVTLGRLYVPVTASAAWLTPLALGTVVLLGSFIAWELVRPPTAAAAVPLRRLPDVVRDADVPGAVLLAASLGCIVAAFASADPSRHVLSPVGGWLLGAAAVLAAAFVVREARCREPLVPLGTLRDPAAYGALIVTLATGAALMAVLVDVPIFARTTRYPGSQLDAALVLVRFLAAVPIGAFLGGAVCERMSYRITAAGGMLLAAGALVVMARWSADALAGIGSTVVLVAAGLGFGVAVAPVNAAMLRAVRASVHGLASALVVVARMTGMLVGVSTLTAVGLHRFYADVAALPSPITLCPRSPTSCPAYDHALQHAALAEIHAVFAGAAVCALVAAVFSFALLRRVRVS